MYRHRIFLSAFVLLSMLFTSCVPDLELAGHSWSADGTINYDDEQVTVQTVMVCTSTTEGALFLSVQYSDESDASCIVMPFTYTWDDNRGTAVATWQAPDYWKGAGSSTKGTYTCTISMNYTKTEGLVISSNDIERLLDFPCTNTILTQTNYAKPANMSGSRWTMDYEEEVAYDDGNGVNHTRVIHYLYQLEFTSTTAATLTMTISDDGNIDEYLQWDISYTYTGGVGITSINFDGETIQGGFYMPDGAHLVFTDGMNRLSMIKQ